MSRIYTLFIDDKGFIEYIEENELFENIYNMIRRIEEELLNIRHDIYESEMANQDNSLFDIDENELAF